MLARCRIRCSFSLVPFALALFAGAGCRGNGDLVESELRSREKELAEAHAEVARLDAYNQALLHELGTVRQGAFKITPELASQTYTVRRIALGGLTGGFDNDNLPGDEALRVVLEPFDPDNHPIKAPGSLHLEVLEISREGLKMPLSAWDFDQHQLRGKWASGLFCSGYTLVLPWKKWPSSDRLRVVARFCLPDGRLFEADRDILIRLPAPGCRPNAPALPPAAGPPLPRVEPDSLVPAPRQSQEILPMPRQLKPTDQQEQQKPSGPSLGEEGIKAAACWHRPESRPLHEAVRLLTPVPLKLEDWLPRR